MPYIDEHLRKALEPHSTVAAGNPGELNYQITCLVEDYRFKRADSYATFNDIIGALEAAKLEFYSRIVTPYEDRKCQENGDVYAPLD
jgi:Domain of unknown function (DUF6899)